MINLVARNKTVPPPETDEESGSVFPFPDETGVHGPIDDGRDGSFENPPTPQGEDEDDEGPDGEAELPADDGTDEPETPDGDEEEETPGGEEEETPGEDEKEETPGDDNEEETPEGDAPLPSGTPTPLPAPSAPLPAPSISAGTPTVAEPIAGATTTVYIEDGYEGPGPEPSANAEVDGGAGVTVTVKVAQGWPEWDANADGRFDEVLRAPTAA